MDYLIHLAQTHETFRLPELQALADHEKTEIEILEYRPESPFCVVRFHPTCPELAKPLDEIARSFASRSILIRGIYEFWGTGIDYASLHEDVRSRSSHLWRKYEHTSFRFTVSTFYGKRSTSQQREIIESFRYVGFQGKITMKNPEVEFTVFEEWELTRELSHDLPKLEQLEENGAIAARSPKRLFFGRYIGGSRRELIDKHDLKKRPYISTTSMDAELALVTASLALAGPGKIFLDPFVGTGGFMVSASELGALTFGSDIDGRSYRGKGPGLKSGVGRNFEKYGLQGLFGDCFTSDLTNSPLRYQCSPDGKSDRWLDGIISDPPYGIREGLKVLGTRQSKLPTAPDVNEIDEAGDDDAAALVSPRQPHYINGILAHTLPGYIAPKKPYSFVRMLDDILDFAARTLVDGGRLAFWIPSANEADQAVKLPQHPLLEMKYVCVQEFNRWSRKLLVYERIKGDFPMDLASSRDFTGAGPSGSTADDLNPFRKMYFAGFQAKKMDGV